MNTPNNLTSTEDLITIPKLQAKFAQLQADPEFHKKPFWQRIIEIGALVPQSEWRKQFPRDLCA